MTATRAVADQPTTEQADVADALRRVLADFTVPAAHVPDVAAGLVLGKPWLAEALAARPELARLRHTVDVLRMRHRPVPIRPGSEHVVCAATRKHPEACDDCAVLWGQG